MVRHRHAVVAQDVDLLVGILTLTDDVFRLRHLIDPTLFNLVVKIFNDFGVFEVFRVGIHGIDGGIALLVGAVLRKAVEATGGFLGGFGDRFLQVTAGRRHRSDEGDGTGLSVVQFHITRTSVEVGDDGREIDGEAVLTRQLLQTVTHLTQSLSPT